MYVENICELFMFSYMIENIDKMELVTEKRIDSVAI